MRTSFRYRLYPTRQQTRAMIQMLDTHRHLYNRALAERKDAWEQDQRSVRYTDQSAQLKLDRTTNPYLAHTNFTSSNKPCAAWTKPWPKGLPQGYRITFCSILGIRPMNHADFWSNLEVPPYLQGLS